MGESVRDREYYVGVTNGTDSRNLSHRHVPHEILNISAVVWEDKLAVWFSHFTADLATKPLSVMR